MTRILSSVVLISALALLACSAPQPPAAQAPADEGSDTPKFGGTLTTWGDDLTDYDMSYQGKTAENVKDHGLVYDTLLGFKKGPGADYLNVTVQPSLAERWEISPDARVYTYYLRKGVKFGNIAPVNGREFTSADVKWTMEYYSRTGEFGDKKLPISQMEAMYEGIDSIDTPDKYTVRIRFKDPFVPFLNYSASQWMPMAAKEVFQADGNLSKRLIGTGPYVMDTQNSQKDARWVFTKNPNYWDAPKPYLDSIRRIIIPDISTRMAAFQVKQIEILTAPADYKSVVAIQQSNPEAKMISGLSPGQTLMFISQKRGGATTDIRVRKAISLAMDRDEYNNMCCGGKGAWVLAGAYPGLFTDAEVKQMLRYDPEEAKKLLAEAGYGGGLKMEYMPTTVGALEQLIQAQLKRVGIEATFVSLAREQHRARLYVGDFDLYQGGGSSIGDADVDAYQSPFLTTSGQNWSVIKDPELDKLVLAQRREADPQKRREAQRAVVKRIHEMSWNPGFIFAPTTIFWHPYVKNFGPIWTVGQHDAFAWLDK